MVSLAPCRSNIRPMNGMQSAPPRVPIRYAVEMSDREIPRSFTMGSMKTEIAAVWPGAVMTRAIDDNATMRQP